MKFVIFLAIILILIYLLMPSHSNDPNSSFPVIPSNDEESEDLLWRYSDRATIIMIEDRFEAIKKILHKYDKSRNIETSYEVDGTIGKKPEYYIYKKNFKGPFILNKNYVKSLSCSIHFNNTKHNKSRECELHEKWVLQLDTFCFDFDDEFESAHNDIACSLHYDYYLVADSTSIKLWLSEGEIHEYKDVTMQELSFLLKKCGIGPFSDPAKWFSKNKGRYLQKEFQDSVLDKHKLLMPTRYIHGR